MTFISQLSLVAPTTVTFLILYIFISNQKDYRNRILLMVLAIIAVGLWARYLFAIRSEILLYLPFLLFPIVWLHGPLTYYYILACTTDRRWSWKIWLAFMIPVLLVFLFICWLHSAFPELGSLNTIVQQKGIVKTYTVFLILGLSLYSSFFLIKSYLVLKSFQKGISKSGLYKANSIINWLTLLVVLVFFYYVLFFISAVFTLFDLIEQIFQPLDIIFTFFLIYIFLYYIVKKPEVINLPDQEATKYARHSLDTQSSARYKQMLLNFMDKEKPYLDENLSLNSLAELVAIPAHHLSIIINRDLGMNFFHFISSYRVREAMTLLKDERYHKKPLIRICFDAGFQSKATFNASFKRVTGMTPTQYRKQISESSDSSD